MKGRFIQLVASTKRDASLAIDQWPARRRRFLGWIFKAAEFAAVQGFVQLFLAAAGLIIVRTLPKSEYALFAIANSMQVACTQLADLGIGPGVRSIGGRVWNDKFRLGELLNTALGLRRRFFVLSLAVCVPVTAWLLWRNNAGITRACASAAGEALSRLNLGNFWRRICFAANRKYPAAADKPIWLRQSIRNATGTGLSTIVWIICLQWYSLQPRVATARGKFVTRKIARAAARIARNRDENLVLGNLESRRDWGRAQNYVEAMWLMLQHQTADDYVVATGETHSVREFVEAAFAVVDLSWEKYVKHDPSLDRPTEPVRLVGCPEKIRKTLGWQPTGSFPQLVREMVEAELAAIDSLQ